MVPARHPGHDLRPGRLHRAAPGQEAQAEAEADPHADPRPERPEPAGGRRGYLALAGREARLRGRGQGRGEVGLPQGHRGRHLQGPLLRAAPERVQGVGHALRCVPLRTPRAGQGRRHRRGRVVPQGRAAEAGRHDPDARHRGHGRPHHDRGPAVGDRVLIAHRQGAGRQAARLHEQLVGPRGDGREVPRHLARSLQQRQPRARPRLGHLPVLERPARQAELRRRAGPCGPQPHAQGPHPQAVADSRRGR